jgi:hypothetical protein
VSRAVCYSDCFFAFAHLAKTAFRALALRSSGVIFAARAGPPLSPPLRPRATAAGSFSCVLVCDDIPPYYVSGQEKSTKISIESVLFFLTIRERSRIITRIEKGLLAGTNKPLLKTKRDCSH